MAAQTATMSAGLQTCQVRSVRSAPRFQPLIPAAARRASLRTATVAQAKRSDDSMQTAAALAVSSVVGSFMAAGSASAATELAQIAASDNRFGLLLTLAAPALGWVLFNIGGPAQSQLENMKGKKAAIATGLGLAAASLLAAPQADAATEIAQVAGDGRIGVLLLVFVPVVGWVLFNIGGPALNQLNNMGGGQDVAKTSRPMKGKKGGR